MKSSQVSKLFLYYKWEQSKMQAQLLVLPDTGSFEMQICSLLGQGTQRPNKQSQVFKGISLKNMRLYFTYNS